MGYAITRQQILAIVSDALALHPPDGATAITNAIADKIKELDPCYGKAMTLPDRPRIFVLLPTDDLAPGVVTTWAWGASQLPSSSRRFRVVPEAYACAREMTEWRDAHPELA